MRVLGITTEGDSGAAIVEDGRILAAVNEERLSRWKLVEGFPRESIRTVAEMTATDLRELDAVMVAATSSFFVDELQPFDGWFQHWDHGGFGGLVKRAAGRLARYRAQLPFMERAYYALLEPSFASRRQSIRRVLQEEFGISCPIHFVDHHFAHVTSAYFTSGFDDALVVSLDGGGDGRSGLVYAVRGGRFEYITEVSAYNSLGNYYAYVTHLCGFKAMKHEGKITGLSAHGDPKYVPLLREFIDEHDGHLVNHGKVVFRGAIEALERRLPDGWTREDLAASIQQHFEDLTRRFVDHWARHTGLKDVALAGGVFANVRVNEEVHRLDSVERVSVHPHMGDGGLGVGAALSACVPGVLETPMPRDPDPITDVYLGPELGEEEIRAAMREEGLEPLQLDRPTEEVIAELLDKGHVVARAAGRMEYGPRALGNRSILYHPTDARVNDWLNDNLQRTEFMPFAPSILWEARDDCFHGVDGGDHAGQFMTITFHSTEWMDRNMPGVVHIDGTARPHFVRRDRNPGYYAILEAFHRRTGLPGIINTSFNMHEEPIVCSATDCIRAFLAGNLDYLNIGDFIVQHPSGVNHPIRTAVHAEDATARVS